MSSAMKHLVIPAALALSISGCSLNPWHSDADTASDTPPAETAQQKQEAIKQHNDNIKLTGELDWFPNLTNPIDQLQKTLDSKPDAATRDLTASNLAYLYDARLFVLFQDMLDYLPNAARENEIEQQRKWLDQRKQALMQAFASESDAKAGRYKATEAFIASTQARIKEIEQRRKIVVFK